MDRKKALKTITFTSLGIAGLYAGFKSYKILKVPDLQLLTNFESLLGELAEEIIPDTDSPGAKAAEVTPVLIHLLQKCANRNTLNNFIEGLENVQQFSQKQYGSTFEACEPAEKVAILNHFQEKGKGFSGFIGKVEKRIMGQSFFETLKKYTVIAYCTSQKGATEGLAYDYIPGKFIGHIPLQPNQKAWATS